MLTPISSHTVVCQDAGGRNAQENPSIRLLAVAALVVVTIVAVTSVLLLQQSRSRAITDTMRELSTGAVVLSEDTDRAFQALELIQSGLIERISSLGVTTPEEFIQRMSGADTYQTLHDEIAALPYIDGVSLVDWRGNLINSSRSWPLGRILNVADFSFFQVLGKESSPPTYLEEPVLSRTTNTWTVVLARKITAPNGELLGFVNCILQMNYFERFYKRISFGKDTAIILLRNDGVLLFSYPRRDQRIGQSLAKSPVFGIVRDTADRGGTRSVSQLDGQDRVIAAHALGHYPVLLAISIPVTSALEVWRIQAEQVAAVVVLLSLAIAGATLLGARHLKSQSRLSAAEAARSVAEAELKAARSADVKIRHMAQYDALTDLPNRVLFHEKLEHALGYARRGTLLALHFIDLDQFKAVNDTLGHPIGDRLLQAVAGRLLGNLRDTDTVARLGGDEFAIVQTALESPLDATAFAERTIAMLREPFAVDEHQIVIGASVGIAFAPQDAIDADQLLKCADLALYRAKVDGRGVYRLFHAEMDARMQARRVMELDLHQALYAGQFELFYQPLIDLRIKRTVGFEALLRWRHPTKGIILPEQFIPLAEETGMIVPIGELVLRQACAAAAKWPDELKVAVNLSAAQFKSNNLVTATMSALHESGLDPHRLELEITETVMLQDTELTLTALHRFQDLGIQIAMDDFGTGYSSLNYLRRFPFNRIKIDQSFVRELGKKADCMAIVRAVAAIGNDLGMAITAEGVETRQQRDTLERAGCTEFQGFLFSRPVPGDRVIDLLRTMAIGDDLLPSADERTPLRIEEQVTPAGT